MLGGGGGGGGEEATVDGYQGQPQGERMPEGHSQGRDAIPLHSENFWDHLKGKRWKAGIPVQALLVLQAFACEEGV